MAVTTTTSRIPYTGDGSSTVFPVPFYFLVDTDIRVYSGESLLTSGYSVIGAGDEEGGSVKFDTAPAPGVQLTILRAPDMLQQTRLPPNDPFPSGSVEKMSDKLTMIVQRNSDQISRALVLADFDVDGSGAYRANQNRIQDVGDPVNPQDAVNKRTMETAIADIVTDGAGTAVLTLLADEVDPTKGAALIGFDGDTIAHFLRDKNSRLVHSTAELRTVDSTKYKSVYRTGYFSDGDGGHALYRLDASDTTTADDGGFCVVAGDGKRWKIVHEGIIGLSAFGALGAGSITADNMVAYLTKAWNSALARGHNLFASAGRRDTGEKSMPWRQETVASLLDCQNVTLIGEGPNTIFSTTSVGGADVFQLNGLKNFHIRNLAITATLTGTAGSGSNGISITSGYDNITIDGVQVYNLPSLDKGTYVDGGKALTVQSDAATNEVGTLTADIYAKGCAQGFGFEADLVNMLSKKVAVNVNIVAEDCFEAVIYSAGAATGIIPAGAGTGIRVRGTAINCQIDALVSRAHGIDIDLNVVTTKTATARTKNPTGTTWYAANQVVQALLCAYAKDSRIAITGNKGGCHYKAQIGGATAGSSGQGPSTDGCSFYLDIGGTSTVSDLNDVISGGSSMSTSTLYISPATATTFPASFYAEANANTLTRGPTMRLVSPLVSADLRFAMSAAGNVETGRIDLFGNITGLQGKATGTTDQAVVAMYDSAGTARVGIVNGNGIAIDAVSTSSNIGSYVGKYRVLRMDGTTLGYFPVYQ